MKKAFPVKIGLEVHGYLNTQEKLFCMCRTQADVGLENPNSQFGLVNNKVPSTSPEMVKTKSLAHPPSTASNQLVKTSSPDGVGDIPNSRVCPICTGQPGSKPMMVNKAAVEKMIQIALVLGCRINHGKDLVWQRKHYNWADLPKGHQNTISGPHAVLPAVKGRFKGIRITECHLEEDPAQWNPDTGRINYNRSGLPLIEIVTEPDFSSAEDVIVWLKDLLLVLSYVKAIRKGSGIKVDVNVSTYGDRVEMKNINSLDSIKRAIEYEIERQKENAGKVEQKRETLAYDAATGRTVKMREKEGAADYRFIPDPDLPVIDIDVKWVGKLKSALPEMPEVKLKKLLKSYKLDKRDAEILSKNLDLVEFVEALVDEKVNLNKNISWITIELLRILNYNRVQLEDVEIEPVHLAELIEAVACGDVTVLKAKQIMNDFIPKSFSVGGMKGIGKVDDVESICKKAIAENRKAVEDYKSGNESAMNFLVGQVMQASERRADFKTAGDCLKSLMR